MKIKYITENITLWTYKEKSSIPFLKGDEIFDSFIFESNFSPNWTIINKIYIYDSKKHLDFIKRHRL